MNANEFDTKLSNYEKKKFMIYKILDNIKSRSNKHYNKFSHYKKKNRCLKVFINILNSISVCSLVISLRPTDHLIIFISLASSTLSTILSAYSSVCDYNDRSSLNQLNHLQYIDLYRNVKGDLLKNNLSSKDLDDIIDDLNNKLSLIENHGDNIDHFSED